jgi:amino-acid N-acetyltransferase
MTRKPAQQVVNWFRDAAPYINRHRGKTFVVYFSGEVINSGDFDALIYDLALLHSMGIKLVLAFGARPQIEQRLRNDGIELRYAQGLRITDREALEGVVEAVGKVRMIIEAKLTTSMENTPMSGSQILVSSGNYMLAKPLGVREGVDFGHTGEVRRVNTEAICQQLDAGHCVLLPPLGYSPTGEVFNLSAEEVATATACALRADKLILLNDDVLKNPLPAQLSLEDIAGLNKRRKLPEDTLYHLQNAQDAILNGVKRCHILASGIDGSLLLELFTRDGIGTLISANGYETIRPAEIHDVAGVLELIEPLESKGVLVRRSREQLELEINQFHVIERDGLIIGCAALYPFPEDNVGELACLAVHPEYRGENRGDLLLSAIADHARVAGIEKLFVLSTQTMHWFRERGFVPGDLSQLPVKRARLYNYQRQSKIFFKNLA